MITFVDIILRLLMWLIVARAILSFVIPLSGGRPHPVLVNIINVVNQITEPILSPIRRILPSFGMVDLSPLVAIIILFVIRLAILRGA